MVDAGRAAAAEGGGPASSARGASRRYGLIAVVAVIVLAADQLSKAWALDALGERTIPVVWTLRLNLARNTGAAFSVGRGTDWGRYIPLLALVVVAVVVIQGRSVTSKLGAVAIGMIVGGALGNLVDRALRTNGGGFFSGGVIDFIDFQWWPIFNVADMGVVVGGLLLVVASLRAPATDGPDPNPSTTNGAEAVADAAAAGDPRPPAGGAADPASPETPAP